MFRSMIAAIVLAAVMGAPTAGLADQRAASESRAEHHGPFAIFTGAGLWQIAAHVTPAAAGSASAPTGTVTFTLPGGVQICGATSVEQLQPAQWGDPQRPEAEAMCNVADPLVVGRILDEGFTASYSGDDTFAPSHGEGETLI